MKRSTGIRRLGDVADGLARLAAWSDVKPQAGYVYGDLVEGHAEFERVQLVITVDEPADAIPWMARPPHLEAAGAMVRFDRLALDLTWRSNSWPTWNHRIVGPVRIWSATDGLDEAALAALKDPDPSGLDRERPANDEELLAQLYIEREVARRHFDNVLDQFYDRDWRGRHKNSQYVRPEDHLWWAAAGYRELDNAISERTDNDD